MADLGAFFGNPNLQRQGARARALASQRDVNTLPDPLTYAVMQGLLGTRPDEMGFSVLNPDYEKIKKVAEPAFALGLLGQAAPALAPLTKSLPVGASIKNVGQQSLLDVAKRDASDIFGAGAQRIRYTDPRSGGAIDVLSRPDGTASVLGLEVPETFRGQGVGSLLQSKVLQDFPDMQGQVSSKAAATNAYKLGRRPPNMPNATIDDVYKMIDEDSSVNLISPQMQQRIAPTPETGLLGQEVTDYRGSHQAPSPDFGAPLYDLTGGGQMYPADVYSSKAAQFYGGGVPYDQKAFSIAQQYKDKPDALVTIYRAVPKEASNSEKLATLEKQMSAYMKRGTLPKDADNYSSGSKWYDAAYEKREQLRKMPDEPSNDINAINAGDWVTLTKEYAKDHGESALKGEYKILSKKVKAKEVFTNADSIHEFGYQPQVAKPIQAVAPQQEALDTAQRNAVEYPLAPAGTRYEEFGGQLTYMTPDEYLSRVRPLELDDVSLENIAALKSHVQSGGQLDPLHIYQSGKEDGRHRAYMAKELGIEKIPVALHTEANNLGKNTPIEEGLLAIQKEQPMQGLLQSKVPSPSSLTMPDVPTIEQMQKYGRVETVPLSQAVSFQSARNWDKFNKGEHVGDLVQGFGDKPLALRLENGEYIIYDGNHRTDLAMQAGKTELPMNVIDVKSYDPAHAGRKPVPDRIDPDELLRSLLE